MKDECMDVCCSRWAAVLQSSGSVSLAAAGAEGRTVVGIQRSRTDWIAAVTGGTKEASRCHRQCVACLPRRIRHAQVVCWRADARKHTFTHMLMFWICMISLQNRIHTYIRVMYLYAKQLLAKHLHLCGEHRNRRTYIKTSSNIMHFNYNSWCRRI